MKRMKLVLLSSVCAFGGCASVMSGRDADVVINSMPSAAHVAVKNEKGQTVATGVTPAKISLKRGNGFFRKAPRYVATIEKPGYQPARVPINPQVNPWIAGNIVLGGVIGLAADSATGAMWKFSPTEIERRLTPYGDDSYSQSEGGEVAQVSHVAADGEPGDRPNGSPLKESRGFPSLRKLLTPGAGNDRPAAKESDARNATE